jgi:hypothetical protein
MAEQGEVISGLELLNKGLNALYDSRSAFIQELGDVIRSKGVEREYKPAAKPVQVSHSELAAACISEAFTEEPT